MPLLALPGLPFFPFTAFSSLNTQRYFLPSPKKSVFPPSTQWSFCLPFFTQSLSQLLLQLFLVLRPSNALKYFSFICGLFSLASTWPPQKGLISHGLPYLPSPSGSMLVICIKTLVFSKPSSIPQAPASSPNTFHLPHL